MSDTRREVARLVRELRRAGFVITRTGSGHWKCQSPAGGGMVIIAFSPRKAGLHRTMSQLRNLGYDPRG